MEDQGDPLDGKTMRFSLEIGLMDGMVNKVLFTKDHELHDDMIGPWRIKELIKDQVAKNVFVA
ncbi:unnamed protein product [Lupinus luteus]|uniref:Uncharacterized protein n=1 Tax=Lupinus luteus TaxID=3873 RepID=A0AAV1Y9P2_LUPLU